MDIILLCLAALPVLTPAAPVGTNIQPPDHLGGVVRPQLSTIEFCGDQAFDTSQYTCYSSGNGTALCPVINGLATKLCNHDCYSSYQYTCNGDTLAQLDHAPGPVTLKALNPTAPFNNLPVNAGGLGFQLAVGASTYCPQIQNLVCPNTTQTIFAGSGLVVEVPGGQEMYIKKDGALAFTQAHSTSMYNLSYYGGGAALSNAGYYGPWGSSWVACPLYGSWKVYSDLPEFQHGDDCIGFTAVAENQPSGTWGAWQYV